MDLIYARNVGGNFEDIGVLVDYKFDLAYGEDENNYTLQLMTENHKCQYDDFLYIENTEYGGIVDGISSDTENGIVTYSGRTWHGMLAGKIICPDAGDDYFYVSGRVQDCIIAVIRKTGLDSVFSTEDFESEVDVAVYYRFERYTDAYSGIMNMLKVYDLTAVFVFKNGKVHTELYAIQDYSQESEFDNTQQGFTVSRTINNVNHLICLGSGDMSSRHVLHLFTDENGGLQPYAKKEKPLKDNDYILDTSGQILFGKDEIAKVYDCTNAKVIENYEVMSEIPPDWETNFSAYYAYELINYPNSMKRDFINLSLHVDTNYVVVSEQPDDWHFTYSEYFYLDESGEYKNIEPFIYTFYSKLESKPNDWESSYGNYYERHHDGVEEKFKIVAGNTKNEYKLQTKQPTDWEKNYKNYFQKKTEKKKTTYIAVESIKVKKGKKEEEKAPKWKRKKYFTKYSFQIAPTWKKDTFYMKTDSPTAAYFDQQTVYKMVKTEIKPAFISNMYFKKVQDHYADLAEKGIKKLYNFIKQDDLKINLTIDNIYNINDMVGARDNVTGMFAQSCIVKKIVTIEKNMVSVDYEVSGN